jgi:hypothetical protein
LTTIDAQCRCGAIALKIIGKPAAQLYCHCDDCQAAHGAAYALAAVYPAAAVRIERGRPAQMVVKSTPRMRCPDCGAHLFSELARVGMRSLNAYLLPKGEFRPQFHVQCQHAVLPVIDDLPHYKAFPAAFGGVEEFVDW